MTAQPFKTIVLDLLQQGHLDEEAFLQELNETERTAIGMPELWSAKDHMAHRTFWHQDLILKVNAILQHQEIPSSEESDDQINAIVFEENKLHPWSALHVESERVYAELITLAEHLSEEDLTDSHRFASITGGSPLYTAFLGSCYEHDQEHLAQCYSDRNDLPRAIQVREKCANRVLQAELPEWVKGWFLYNLACFYAQQNQLQQAVARLQEAVAFAPRLKERSQSDPDLVALRNQSA
jgi:tetratricopeptide (TPR) repeat protein